ncbi:SDR family oxidoreductase [Erwinia pyrifoliae]|uniref:SDR family oxidoreductase n=1 Tax=Erwinia pyrifoliae TaxID=79967 RepID=UPI001CF53578|nr:SDR family oxidoreductase [Erwinia pyrifoliae]MCT2386038.1 SDR family oxidoreductase [Erwinia pyrifoliae]
MYRAMVNASPAKRMAPPEEMAIASAFLPGSDAGAITGSDLLVDGGVIAAIRASVKLHQRGEAPA